LSLLSLTEAGYRNLEIVIYRVQFV
jgi:hypothetical protein